MDSARVKELCHQAGAAATGIARVAEVTPHAAEAYRRWLASGANAGMHYLEKYDDIRRNPTLLLPGAKSLISCAFAYTSPELPRSPLFADYAMGDDYHTVLREALQPVADALGGNTRICVDTAPLPERYWAQQAGTGYVGLNGQLIVPGVGSAVFLAEILWDGELEPDAPLNRTCRRCGACLRACPGKALNPIGPTEESSAATSLDARRCLSYLTIEHRGPFAAGGEPQLGGRRIYGCDICRDVCPESRPTAPVAVLPALRPRPEVLSLTLADIAALDSTSFPLIFRRSAVKRAKLEGLLRNVHAAYDKK